MTTAEPEIAAGRTRAVAALILLGLLFFLVTAGSFTALGAVLPDMVTALKWNWTGAGLGYTILGLSCGLASFLPALLIRRVGVRLTLLLGASTLCAGFAVFATLKTLPPYWLGAALPRHRLRPRHGGAGELRHRPQFHQPRQPGVWRLLHPGRPGRRMRPLALCRVEGDGRRVARLLDGGGFGAAGLRRRCGAHSPGRRARRGSDREGEQRCGGPHRPRRPGHAAILDRHLRLQRLADLRDLRQRIVRGASDPPGHRAGHRRRHAEPAGAAYRRRASGGRRPRRAGSIPRPSPPRPSP